MGRKRVGTGRTWAARTVRVAVLVALVSAVLPGATGPAGATGTAAAPGAADACPPGLAQPTAVGDLGATATHAAAISCLLGWEIVRGRDDGMFAPFRPANRGQFAIALHNLLAATGVEVATSGGNGFVDVGDGHVAEPAVAGLADAGVLVGRTDDRFAPGREVTRGQIATLLSAGLQRFHDVLGDTAPSASFRDTPGTTHAEGIRRLAAAGLADGFSDGTFRPDRPVTRAQLAAFLQRALQLLVADGAVAAPSAPEFSIGRLQDPARTVVRDAQGARIATFTDGARTVALAGPHRRFEEQGVEAGVDSRTWVRILDRPFAGEVDWAWLANARADTSPDVLATAMQYLPGAPDVVDDGVLLAADAGYGPLRADGYRPVGSDWHDFQGVAASADEVVRPARAERYRQVDCSGYVRLVFGVRFGFPLSARPDGGVSLPRRATQQANEAPGVVPIRDRDEQVTDFSRLQPGDLVFFDASPSDEIDHVGIYLGTDDDARHRFISSRRSVDGVTLGDRNGASLLDGSGYFAVGFRASRRL